jgi:hypothetical protein
MGRDPKKTTNRNSPRADLAPTANVSPAPLFEEPTTGHSLRGQMLAVSAYRALQEMLIRDDGWLRVVPHERGAVTFYKWKFSRGPWQGYYLMYRDDRMNPSEALCGLVGKLEAVDLGRSKPVKDTAFS